MKLDLKNNIKLDNRLLQRMVVEKKKSAMAAILVLFMVIMWIRVFSSKVPSAAKAVGGAETAGKQADSESQLKLTFFELPDIAGRDRLARDFFCMDTKSLQQGRAVSVVSESDGKGHIKRITNKLRLETIVLGDEPQAFINDKLLMKGDVLLVKDGIETYECEIEGIEENSVLVKCRDSKIKLKLTHPAEVAN